MQSPLSSRTKAELFLLSVTFVWGTTFVLTKFILQHVSPFLYIALRFFLASFLFVLLFPRRISGLKTSSALKGGLLGLFLAIGFALQTIGLQFTSASKSAFITGMLVVFTPLFQLLIERKPPKIGNILGVLLVIVGLYFLTLPTGSGFNRGDALTLGCALTFALYIVSLDIFGKQHDAAQLTIMQFAVTAIAATVMLPFVERPEIQVTVNVILTLSFLVVFATVVALYVQTKYQADTTPTRSAVIFSVEPVIAAGFAALTLGERIGFVGVVGGGLIVCGVLVSELSDLLFKSNQKSEPV